MVNCLPRPIRAASVAADFSLCWRPVLWARLTTLTDSLGLTVQPLTDSGLSPHSQSSPEHFQAHRLSLPRTNRIGMDGQRLQSRGPGN